MGTKNNPGAFDCYNNAKPDEPMFTLLGRDKSAALIVALWVRIRVEMGDTDEAMLREADDCALMMEHYAKSLGKNPHDARVAFRKVIAKLALLSDD